MDTPDFDRQLKSLIDEALKSGITFDYIDNALANFSDYARAFVEKTAFVHDNEKRQEVLRLCGWAFDQYAQVWLLNGGAAVAGTAVNAYRFCNGKYDGAGRIARENGWQWLDNEVSPTGGYWVKNHADGLRYTAVEVLMYEEIPIPKLQQDLDAYVTERERMETLKALGWHYDDEADIWVRPSRGPHEVQGICTDTFEEACEIEGLKAHE